MDSIKIKLNKNNEISSLDGIEIVIQDTQKQ